MTALKAVPAETMDPIARLRLSRERDRERFHAEGIARGRYWAKHQAEYEELARVARVVVLDQYDWAASDVVAAVAGETLTRREYREVAEQLFGDADPWLATVAGFVEGAREVLDQVEQDG